MVKIPKKNYVNNFIKISILKLGLYSSPIEEHRRELVAIVYVYSITSNLFIYSFFYFRKRIFWALKVHVK